MRLKIIKSQKTPFDLFDMTCLAIKTHATWRRIKLRFIRLTAEKEDMLLDIFAANISMSFQRERWERGRERGRQRGSEWTKKICVYLLKTSPAHCSIKSFELLFAHFICCINNFITEIFVRRIFCTCYAFFIHIACHANCCWWLWLFVLPLIICSHTEFNIWPSWRPNDIILFFFVFWQCRKWEKSALAHRPKHKMTKLLKIWKWK